MNTTAFSRVVATMVGAAAVITTITTTPVASQAVDGEQDRQCFMVRSHWNDAEGPQPTCPDGRWMSDIKGGAPTTAPAVSGSLTRRGPANRVR